MYLFLHWAKDSKMNTVVLSDENEIPNIVSVSKHTH